MFQNILEIIKVGVWKMIEEDLKGHVKNCLFCSFSCFTKELFFICKRTGTVKAKLVLNDYDYYDLIVGDHDNVCWCPDKNGE